MLTPRLTPSRRAAAVVSAVAGAAIIAVGGSGQAVTGSADPGVGRQADGSVRTPQGQVLTPAGQQLELGGRPVDIAVRPDGRTATVLVTSAGASLALVDLTTGTLRQTQSGAGSSYAGIAYAPDGATLWSSDDAGRLVSTPVAADGSLGTPAGITLTSTAVGGGNPVPTGVAVAPDGRTVYVALSRDNSVAVVDVATRTAVRRIAVGNAPHSLILLDGRLWVSNEGGRPAALGDTTTDSAGTAIVSDAFSGAATTGTVSVIDTATSLVSATVPVGLHPTALTADSGHVFVANTNDDSVSVVDAATTRVVGTISITPFPLAPYGSQPTGLAVDGDRLLVTLGNDNAVASFRLTTPSAPAVLEGLVPTAAYPASIAVDRPRGRVVVPNLRGVGSVADRDAGRSARSVGGEVGSISLLTVPTGGDLVASTRRVAINNHWDTIDTACASPGATPTAIPQRIGEPSTIKHVVYIVKENRTYDQVLGDLPRGNGDPSLAVYGRSVTPNQHALAEQFTLFDDFYDSGRRSNDGHNWAVAANSPDYLEKGVATRRTNLAPPSVGTPPSSGFDSLLYTPSGFIWENVLRHGGTIQDFGEYTRENATPPAQAGVPSLDPAVVRDYPGYNLNYPDVMRADVFLRELAVHSAAGTLPTLTLMTLSNDHTGGSDPRYPTPAAQVADNDLATGRIIDGISHSPFWPDTAVFVVEDDSQGGADHVDGHRSTLFVASPYTRRGAVNSATATQISVVRTIEQILGLPPMNQLDLAAAPLRAAFTDTPDPRPFTALGATTALGARNPPLASRTGLARAWSEAVMREDLAHLDAANEQILNRSGWYETKGFDVPYPGDARVLWPAEVPPSQRGQGAQGGGDVAGVTTPAAARVAAEPSAKVDAQGVGGLGARARVGGFVCAPTPTVAEVRAPVLLAGAALLLLALRLGWTPRRLRRQRPAA